MVFTTMATSIIAQEMKEMAETQRLWHVELDPMRMKEIGLEEEALAAAWLILQGRAPDMTGLRLVLSLEKDAE